MIRDEDKINKYFFFGKQPNLLMPFILQMDTLKGLEKRSVAIDIVKDATLDELTALEEIGVALTPSPTQNSFLFRLGQAIQMRRYIASFEVSDFSQLSHFLQTEPDVLHCYAELILALSETASHALVANISMSEEILNFYKILKSMLPMVRFGNEAHLLKSFERKAKEHLEALEDEQEEKNSISIGCSRDATFGRPASAHQTKLDVCDVSTDDLSKVVP